VQCQAEYGAEIPKRLKRLIQRSRRSKGALRSLEKVLLEDQQFRSLIGTTQAIDIIQGASCFLFIFILFSVVFHVNYGWCVGGVKSNALPEQAYAIVNHRISTQRCAPRPLNN
jgi:Gly-Xaa carboxypeptidase